MLIELPSPQILDIAGADAEPFAQAQFCNDLRELRETHWQWNAWLSAQGRVRAWFHLLRLPEGRLRLLLRGGSAQALRDALSRYVLRSKVRLEVLDSAHLLGAENESDNLVTNSANPADWDVVQFEDTTVFALPGASRRWLMICERSRAADKSDDAVNRWRAADIQAGIADLAIDLEDRFLPNWLGLDAFGITSLRKGCYPGQEIVARLHFKGGNKRWLHQLAFSGSALPQAGTELRDADSARGTLVSSAWIHYGQQAIALAVLDDVGEGSHLHAIDIDGDFQVVARINPRGPPQA